MLPFFPFKTRDPSTYSVGMRRRPDRHGRVEHLLRRARHTKGFGERPLSLSLLNTLRLFAARPGTLWTRHLQTDTPEPKPTCSADWEGKGKDSRLWVQIPALPPTGSVTLGRLVNCTEPRFCLCAFESPAVPPSEWSRSFPTWGGASPHCCWLWGAPGSQGADTHWGYPRQG